MTGAQVPCAGSRETWRRHSRQIVGILAPLRFR